LVSLLNLHGKDEKIKINETKFYEKIVRLPYISNTHFKLFQDINIENVSSIVEDLTTDFRKIYLPIVSELSNLIQFDPESKSFIITNTKASRRYFAENINFEVIKCMHLVLKHCN
jgi:regulator of sigma D